MGIRDDIGDFLGGLVGSSSSESSSSLGGSIDITLTIVFFAVIVFTIFVVGRGIKHFMSFSGSGDELGLWKIHIMGKSMVKGNLNIHEHITDTELEMLEGMSEDVISDNAKSYKQRFEDKELFLYDFRITDYDEAWDLKGGRDSIIVTSVPIESDQFSWMDDKGDRSIVSPTFRQKAKNVFAFITSEYHPEYVDPYGQLKDIYELVVIPKNVEVKMKDGKHGYETQLVMTSLSNGVNDVMAAEYLKTIAESYKKIEPAEKEVNRLRDRLHEKDKEISDVYRIAEDDRHLAYPEPVVGEKVKKHNNAKSSIIGIVIFATFMGGIGYGLPDLIPALHGIFEPMIGVGIAVVLMFLIVSYYFEKKPQKEREEMGIE